MIKWNLDQVVKGLKSASKFYEAKKTEEFRFLVKKTLELLATYSPQFSGYFAASWRVQATQLGGGVAASYTSGSGAIQSVAYSEFKMNSAYRPENQAEYVGALTKIRFRGDPEAIEFAVQANLPNINRLKLNSRVEFYNPVDYAKHVMENRGDYGEAYLRAGNFVGGPPIPLSAVRQRIRYIQ